MIHATRPFIVNEWIKAKIEGYEVSGTVEVCFFHSCTWSKHYAIQQDFTISNLHLFYNDPHHIFYKAFSQCWKVSTISLMWIPLLFLQHVGWWSPTIIRGEDREAIHIPNHKFTMNVVRNLTQKTHWRIKTHLAISHLDVNKINVRTYLIIWHDIFLFPLSFSRFTWVVTLYRVL